MLRTLYKLHRKIGLFVALFWVFLIVTGLLLNHTNMFQLSEYKISNKLIWSLYNLKPNTITRGGKIQKKWLYEDGNHLYVNEEIIQTLDDNEHFILAIEQQGLNIVVSDKRLFLFDSAFEKIDDLAFPSQASDIFMIDQRIVAETQEGVFLADADYAKWEMFTADEKRLERLEPFVLSDAEKKELSQYQKIEGITTEQLILDIHSGRLFGKYGVLLVDLIALISLVLIITGIMIVSRTKRR